MICCQNKFDEMVNTLLKMENTEKYHWMLFVCNGNDTSVRIPGNPYIRPLFFQRKTFLQSPYLYWIYLDFCKGGGVKNRFGYEKHNALIFSSRNRHPSPKISFILANHSFSFEVYEIVHEFFGFPIFFPAEFESSSLDGYPVNK